MKINLQELSNEELNELDNAIYHEKERRRAESRLLRDKERLVRIQFNQEERAKDPEAYDRKTREDAKRALNILSELYMDDE